MIILAANAFDGCRFQRFADAKRRVSFLPGEPLSVGERLPHPSGRICFERIDELADCDGGRDRGVQMNMIRPAVRLFERGILRAGNPAYVRVKTGAPLWIDETSPPFRAPDQMKIYTELFSCHALSNCRDGNLVNKISQKVPHLRRSIVRQSQSRPYGRAYALPALRAYPQICRAPSDFWLLFLLHAL